MFLLLIKLAKMMVFNLLVLYGCWQALTEPLVEKLMNLNQFFYVLEYSPWSCQLLRRRIIRSSIWIKWLKAFPYSIFTLLNLEVSSKILLGFEIWSLLLRITILLPLSAFLIPQSLFLTKLFSALNPSLERFLSDILETCLNNEYVLSRSLLLAHSLLKSPISKLVISLNNISKVSKNSEYSIAFGGIVKLITWKIKYNFIRILACVRIFTNIFQKKIA